MKPDELKELAQLIQLLRESPEVGSIELRRGWFGKRLAVSRNAGGSMAVSAPAGNNAGSHTQAVASEPVRVSAPAAAALKEIRSPMVGTYYSAPEPGADPYIKVGSRVSSGQTVCIIEAMKIMNEIEAEFGGVVREVLVENAQPVEFGHVLFRVDPNG